MLLYGSVNFKCAVSTEHGRLKKIIFFPLTIIYVLVAMSLIIINQIINKLIKSSLVSL